MEMPMVQFVYGILTIDACSRFKSSTLQYYTSSSKLVKSLTSGSSLLCDEGSELARDVTMHIVPWKIL